MLKDYFNNLQQQKIRKDKSKITRKLTTKLAADMDLNMKTEHYINDKDKF